MDDLRKPRIPDAMHAKWQRIVDLLARILDVPAGLVMKLEKPHLVVCVSSGGEKNPYEVGELADLDTGLYCETVMATRAGLLVADALRDAKWKNNPDIKKGMLFYLGLPLVWPDGAVFGTICVLDTTHNKNAVHYQGLLKEFKDIIESDLRHLVYLVERKQIERELQKAHDELEQRVAKRTRELHEMNTALKVLLQKREQDKADLEDRVLTNINERVMPCLEKLKKIPAGPKHASRLRILESSLNDIASPFSNYLMAKCSTLTPTEIAVSTLIAQGRRSKEIAELMSLSASTIHFHRNNIRKKLGIHNRKTSLRSYLASLS